MVGKLMKRLEQFSFDKKMKCLISGTIIIITLVILSITTLSTVLSATSNSKEMARVQMRSISNELQESLQDYSDISMALMLDHNIQNYMKLNKEIDPYYESYSISIRNNMSNILNSNKDINCMVLAKENTTEYLYRGTRSIPKMNFHEAIVHDYEESSLAGYANMKISFNHYNKNAPPKSMNIYQPIYDIRRIGEPIGLLYMNINEPLLSDIFDLVLIDTEGYIMSHEETERIGTYIDFIDKLKGTSGNLIKGSELKVYEKVGKWNYYLVSTIPLKSLFKGSINTACILMILASMILLISLLICSRLVRRSYKPLEKIVHKMSSVSEGNLEVRINESHMGDDFKQIGESFNSMMERINTLMEQVKEEQHQIEEIKLNALQSQIQPHFLYNTLDCIHWQAAALGNQEVSTLVKALATYYRVCLSKGEDIIPLEREMEHVKSYLVIQNIRYDYIIESEIQMSEALKNVYIPKMTLQPLVENSIYHGIKAKEGKKGKIFIQTYEEKGDVIISIADSGSGMTDEQIKEINRSIAIYDEKFGYGVRNVNKRIQLIFGQQYGLHYEKNRTGGVTVRIQIPRNYNKKAQEV